MSDFDSTIFDNDVPLGIFTNAQPMQKTLTVAELLAMRDSVLIAHPKNVAKIPMFTEPPTFDEQPGIRFRMPFDGLPIISSYNVPKSQKTGRVIWEEDPYVTYEDKDREWGLKLGFCKEEEEIVFYQVPFPGVIALTS